VAIAHLDHGFAPHLDGRGLPLVLGHLQVDQWDAEEESSAGDWWQRIRRPASRRPETVTGIACETIAVDSDN
jgi:hypothetical protein